MTISRIIVSLEQTLGKTATLAGLAGEICRHLNPREAIRGVDVGLGALSLHTGVVGEIKFTMEDCRFEGAETSRVESVDVRIEDWRVIGVHWLRRGRF